MARGGRDGRTASAVVLRPILSFAETCGVDTGALLAKLGVPRAALDDPDYRIPEAVHERAWHEAAASSGDPAFGLHVAEHTTLGAYDVLDYALVSSRTLEDAFRRMTTFYRLLCDSLATTVEVRAGEAHVRRSVVGHGSQAAECLLAFLVRRARMVAGDDLTPRAVRFTHAAPRDVAPHAALFRCPVAFDRPTTEIVFDARDFAREVQTSTPGLVDVLDRYMQGLLAHLPAGDTVMDRVQHAIHKSLRDHERPSLEATARVLKASPRTVQRWLGERTTTHRQVVDAVRRDHAVRLLERRDLSITEIAFLLGFADVRGFERTFKQWTGKTPSAVRSPRPRKP